MSDNTPTERFDAPLASEPADEAAKSRTLLYVLIGVGVLLLVVIIILIATLLGRPAATTGDSTPAPTQTESATPTPTPTETSPSPAPEPEQTEAPPPPPAEPTGARFKTFNAPSSESGCSAGGPGFPETRPLLKVSWTTAGADEAWFVMGTSDAADSQYMQIPLNGSQADFQYEQQFNCNDASTTYTITLVAPNGDHVQKHWTVTNTGDQF
jgi:hypothetical protein